MPIKTTFALIMLLSSLRGSAGLALRPRPLAGHPSLTRRLSIAPNAAAEAAAPPLGQASGSKVLGQVTKIKLDGSAILQVWANATLDKYHAH
jgi:hypothetical protein